MDKVEIIYRFGPFTYIDYGAIDDITEQKYLVHPLGITSIDFKSPEPPDIAPLKKMTFELKGRLAPQTYEYVFKEES